MNWIEMARDGGYTDEEAEEIARQLEQQYEEQCWREE